VAEGCRNLERIGPRYGLFARCCRACSSLPSRGFAPGLANRAFFDATRARLSGDGLLVINLAGDSGSYAGLLKEAMHAFDDQVTVFPVPEDGNHILLAFKNPTFEPRWRWLHNHAKELRAKYGLDFPAFVQKIERSAKLGVAYRLRSRDSW